MIRLTDVLTEDYKMDEDSPAAQQAKQMGLNYVGFGRWADPRSGQITHVTKGGKLQPASSERDKLPMSDKERGRDKIGLDSPVGQSFPAHGPEKGKKLKVMQALRQKMKSDDSDEAEWAEEKMEKYFPKQYTLDAVHKMTDDFAKEITPNIKDMSPEEKDEAAGRIKELRDVIEKIRELPDDSSQMSQKTNAARKKLMKGWLDDLKGNSSGEEEEDPQATADDEEDPQKDTAPDYEGGDPDDDEDPYFSHHTDAGPY